MTGDASRYDDGRNTRWNLVAFSDTDDSLLASVPITREQFVRVRELFDYGDDAWFADSHQITDDLWPHVIGDLRCAPPESGKTYFIEGTATDV